MTVVDPKCLDCDSTVTGEITDTGAQLTVEHAPTCPWLAARDQGGGRAIFTVWIAHRRREP